jgi:hypothetical protein
MFAVSEAFPFIVNVQLEVSWLPVEHGPDQIAVRSLVCSVIRVPTGNVAEPVLPLFTLSPLGDVETVTPPRPLTVSVSVAFELPPPHTLGMPPPPQVCGAAQLPQLSVPPQPSDTVPQFFPCALHVVGTQVPGLMVSKAVLVPANDAEMVTCVATDTVEVVIGNVALICPGGTLMLTGTNAAALLLDRKITTPVAVTDASVTVPVDGTPPVTAVGASVNEARTGVVPPHTPGVPPPPQVCGAGHPQKMDPLQPSPKVPHPVTSAHVRQAPVECVAEPPKLLLTVMLCGLKISWC